MSDSDDNSDDNRDNGRDNGRDSMSDTDNVERNYAAEDDGFDLNEDVELHEDIWVVECVGEDQVNDFPDTLAKMAMDATVPTTETWILVYLDQDEAQQAAEYIGGNLSRGRIVETVPDGVNNYVYLESGNVLVFEVA
ncbi:hypothetical protein BH24DEI1_BH24DEI1_06170 [soil metagenome]|jgi:hypothetical protein|nr:hypothetical protein [Deinococcota bacterium]